MNDITRKKIKETAYIFLKALAYWAVAVFMIRSFLTKMIINMKIENQFNTIIYILSGIPIDVVDAALYFVLGIVLALIFHTRSIALALIVWIMEAVFWVIIAEPYVNYGQLGEDFYQQWSRIIATYILTPAFVVAGAYFVLKIKSAISERALKKKSNS